MALGWPTTPQIRRKLWSGRELLSPMMNPSSVWTCGEMLTNLGYLVVGEVGDGQSAINLTWNFARIS